MFNKSAKTVVSAWASSSARSASSLMMIPRNSNVIATNAGYADLEDVRTFPIVIVVAAATQHNYLRDTFAWKNLCTKTVQFAWRYNFYSGLAFVGIVWYFFDQIVRITFS